MAKLLLFNKPFQVLTQFTDTSNRKTLADYIDVANVYAAGRLDYDSEGLLLLTDDGQLQQKISHPRFKLPKQYLVQVEGSPCAKARLALESGIMLKDGLTKKAVVEWVDAPELWPRVPPIRERKHIPTHWLSITIHEGRNRQVRRMTAAVGLPTLRLIRTRIGDWTLNELLPGQYKMLQVRSPKVNTSRANTRKNVRSPNLHPAHHNNG